MKTVLMVHNFYQIGGGEHTVFRNEVQMLRSHGHKVVEYTRSNDELKSSRWKLLLLPFTTLWSWKTYREVRQLIRQEKIDIVHCHNTFPLISPSVYYAARSRKVPVIQTIHNFRFLCPSGVFFCNGSVCEKCRETGNFRNALKNRCYRDSRVQTLVLASMLRLHRLLGTYRKISYIFLTDFNRRKFSELIDVDSPDVYIKPNFVSQPAAPESAEYDHPCFIFAGRLEEGKGIAFLLDAWKRMPEDYELRIYGDGPLREQVQQAARQCNITYCGFRPQEEIFADLKRGTALIFASMWYETFGMTIAEAFSVGCPAVSSDNGNHGDLVRQSSGGTLFTPGDISSLRKALEEVAARREEYGRYAYSYYCSHLSEENNYRRLSEIYDKARHIC